MAGYVPAIDTSWISNIGKTLSGIQQNSQADALFSAAGGTPAQSGGFLSNLFGNNQNAAVTNPPGNVAPQGFLPTILGQQQQQHPTVNPAVSPQVAQAAAGKGIGWPSIPEAQAFGEQVGAQLGMAPGTASAMIGKEYGGPNNPVGDYGSSFGPLQLHYGGLSSQMPHPGMGNDFEAKTGLSAKDPSTWQQQIQFGLQTAAQGGWGPWATSRDKLGWDNRTGLGGNPTQLASAQPTPAALVTAAASVPTAADYANTPPTPANWAGTRDQYIQAYKQSQGGAAPSQQMALSVVPGVPTNPNNTQGIGVNGTPYDANGKYVGYQSSADTVAPQLQTGRQVATSPIVAQGQQVSGTPPQAGQTAAQDQAIAIPGFKGTWTRAQAAATDPNDTSTPDVEDYDKARGSMGGGAPSYTNRPPTQVTQVPSGVAVAPADAGGAPNFSNAPQVARVPASGIQVAPSDTRAPLDMRPAPGQTGPSGVPSVGSGATRTPMGQQLPTAPADQNQLLPNATMPQLMQLSMTKYGELAKLAIQQRLAQGKLTYEKDFPVNDPNSGEFLGTRPSLVNTQTGAAYAIPGAGLNTNAAKETTTTAIKEYEYGQAHQGFARAPKWVPNATVDALGQPQGGWVSPPNPGQPGQPGQPGGQARGGQNTVIIAGMPVDMTRTADDFLSQVPVTYQQAVKNYVAGETMPTGRGGFVQEIKLLAQKYGNDIGMPADDTTFFARKAMRNSLSVTTPNSLGGQINFLNTSIGHLTDLSADALALDNSDGWGLKPLAHAINAVRGQTTAQAEKLNSLKDDAFRYGEEITKFYAGSPGGEAERLHFLDALEGASSPKELAGVISSEVRLIPSRGSAIANQIQQGLGPLAAQYPVLWPESHGKLKIIGENVARLHGWSGLPPPPADGTLRQQSQQQPAAGPPLGSVQIPMGAAALLRRQPVLRQQFDMKYGAGAADKVLGPNQ
jgi:hypothetical protein